MKNLIITVGILLLMMTGILYDLDCQDLVSCERRLKWACEDAAYAAAAVLRSGESWEESEENALSGAAVWIEAEEAAAEVLRRNLRLGADMRPADERAFFEGPVYVRMEAEGRTIRLQADCGAGKTRLPFLRGLIHVKKTHNLTY